MAYTAWSVVFGEQPSAAKWNILGTNDAGFKDGSNIDPSAITPEKLLTGTGTSWPFSLATTPTLTNITIGNGTAATYYKQTGKRVDFLFKMVFGSTSAMGTNPIFSLPVTASANYSVLQPIGNATYEDAGTTTYLGLCTYLTSTTARIWAINSSVTYAREETITSTVPMTWTTSDSIRVTGFYEAA